RAVRQPARDPPGRAVRAARRGGGPRRGGAGRARPGLPGDPDPRPHPGALRPALPPALPVHRRPSRLGPARETARSVLRLLLVLMGAADRVHAAARRLPLRVGIARPRATGPPAPGRDAATDGGVGGADAKLGVALSARRLRVTTITS